MRADNISNIYFTLRLYQLSGLDVVFDSLPNNFYDLSSKCLTCDVDEPAKILDDQKIEPNLEIDLRILKQKDMYTTNSAFNNAEEIANVSDDLQSLYDRVLHSDFCQLKKYALNTVFGFGIEKNPDIMIIGEAPGADEDKQGLPFVGVSGQLLDKIFNTIGVSRTQNAYISNVLKWRPPGNRTPTPEECFVCMPILKKQIELVNPKIIVLAGGVAARAVLGNINGITKIHGNIFD